MRDEPLKDPNGSPIRAIEYHGAHCHSVISDDGGNCYFDFGHCKRDDQVYWHVSGGGPKTPTIELGRMAFPESPNGRCGLWLAPGEQATVDGGGSLEAAGYDLIVKQPPNPFDSAIVKATYYCEWCDDYLPYDDDCVHLCDECGEPVAATLEADGEWLCGQCCVVVDQDGTELWRGEHARQKLCWNEWGETWWEPC